MTGTSGSSDPRRPIAPGAGAGLMTVTDEVDVLVLGFGPAGAAAAIAAHDAGARVLIVEKTGAGGGNCHHSGGFLCEVGGPRAVEHLDALCFGKTDQMILTAYAEGTQTLPEWLAALGVTLADVDPAGFGGMLPSWPHFPGAGHVRYRIAVPGPEERPGPGLWRVLEDAVRGREIPVLLVTTPSALLTADGTVVGAVLENDGERREVRAGGGVVLTTGGFEGDAELVDTYLPVPAVRVGHAANSGDGLRLARSVGAAEWHMSAFFGWYAFTHPDHDAGFPIDVHAPSFVLVDADGHRFADETGWEVHDKVRAVSAYQPRRPNRPTKHGWVVFDEPARVAGPLNGIVGTPNDHVWSADNSTEVAQGWIASGSDVRELAMATGIDPDVLTTTLERYAEAVTDGHDDLFGRSPETLVRLADGPLYAIRIQPGVATASGGPRRDPHGRVLRSGGVPVDGLYAAGANGSIWAHLTEHGGGLTDALVFGRLAGIHAATRSAARN